MTQLDEEAIFHVARKIEPPEARAAYLWQVCGEDGGLRGRVEALLRVQELEASFLESPALGPTASAAEEAMPEGRGTVIGPYKLLEVIGEGGMGVVYMADQAEPVRRRVALKVIKPGMDSRQVIARFEAERQALALMDHPNIAKVLDAGATDSGRPYFVMELVRGIPITDYCDRTRLPVRGRLELFEQVCRAVQHAHQKGIIHRDLKPSNILVTLHDGVPVPKVIDFGIAKATGQSLTDKTLFTGFLQLVGTPLYMSPEQAEVSGLDVDTRSDVYSLGVLLYELLTGTTPFDREAFRTAALDEIRRIIREQEPPTPSSRLSTLGATLATISADRGSDPRRLGGLVRGELDWIALKALEKDRRRRYESAGSLAADVRRHLDGEAVEAHPPSAWYRIGKLARRNRAALTTAAAVVLALLAGTAVSTWQAIRAGRAEQKVAAALGRAEQRSQLARRAVDDMYTQVAEEWLADDGALTPLQREFLEKALAFYEEFAAEEGRDPAVRHEAAEAAGRVGEIRRQLGLFQEAEASYRLALRRFARLAEEYPDRPEFRQGQARTQDRIGATLGALDRHREAEVATRLALAQWRTLVADFPDDPENHRGLAKAHSSLSSVLETTGRRAEAEQVCREGRDLWQALVDRGPAGPDDRHGLAIAEMNLGLVLPPEQLPQREQCYRRALELLEALTTGAPDRHDYHRTMAGVQHNLGNVLERTGREDEAEQAWRSSLEATERLMTEFPDQPGYRERAASTHYTLAELLGKAGRAEESEQQCRRALDLAEGLAAEFPDVPGYRSYVALSELHLASLYRRAGRLDEAESAYLRAAETWDGLATAFPDVAFYRERAVISLFHVGSLHARAGRFDDAKAAFLEVLAASQRLADDFPDGFRESPFLPLAYHQVVMGIGQDQAFLAREASWAAELARKARELGLDEELYWKCMGLIEYCDGRWDAAIRATERCIELRGDNGWQFLHLILAAAHARLGEMEEARSWYARAAQRGMPAADEDPKGGTPRWLFEEAATLLVPSTGG